MENQRFVNIDEFEHNTFGFDCKFESPQASNGLRSERPFKYTKTEYWLMPWTSLIGNVGGEIGLFIGFSLLGTFDGLLSVIDRMRLCLCKKNDSNNGKSMTRKYKGLLLEVLVYTGLLAIGLGFTHESIVDYIQSQTSQSVYLKQIDLSDLPTITFCLKTDYGDESIIYGKDFSLKVHISEEEEMSTELTMNRNVETILGLLIHLREMKQTMRREKDDRGGEWSTLSQC